ncbi:MAG TPA: L,D-transpeptidase, partial [Bradyrhizobium sp.]|nr:L,D-transpeptidase [Bradyrhizobium sp.]
MIMDGGNANAGAIDEAALLRSGLLDRRSFLFGSAISLGTLGLAGCAITDDMSEAKKIYGPVADKRFDIPAVDVSKLDAKYVRRTVRYDTKEAPGTIIVDPGKYHV